MVSWETILISFILSALIGIERQINKKPVGFAPHVFMSVTSAALTEVLLKFYPGNAIFAIGGMLSAIGFIGAGALIKYHEKIFGFTTAAILWSMGILGIIAAFKEWLILASLYSGIILTLALEKLFEIYGLGGAKKTIIVETKGMRNFKKIEEIVKKYGASEIERSEINFDREIIDYRFTINKKNGIDKLIEELEKLEDIKRIHIE